MLVRSCLAATRPPCGRTTILHRVGNGCGDNRHLQPITQVRAQPADRAARGQGSSWMSDMDANRSATPWPASSSANPIVRHMLVIDPSPDLIRRVTSAAEMMADTWAVHPAADPQAIDGLMSAQRMDVVLCGVEPLSAALDLLPRPAPPSGGAAYRRCPLHRLPGRPGVVEGCPPMCRQSGRTVCPGL